MTNLRGKTIFITGGSRGIGRAIALRAAADGANVVIAAKTDLPHPILSGTIHSVAREIEALGGKALPLQLDVRKDDDIRVAVTKAVEAFGGIDILVNNASALNLSKTLDLPMSRFDLLLSVNLRGTFATTQACLPFLLRAPNAHVLVLSPPLDLVPAWFGDHCAYTISKYGMSMCVLGLAEEFRAAGVAVNALWPQTMINTAASETFGLSGAGCRSPKIMADAAHTIFIKDSINFTGNFFLDEEVLRQSGVTDFEKYAIVPDAPLTKDLFIR